MYYKIKAILLSNYCIFLLVRSFFFLGSPKHSLLFQMFTDSVLLMYFWGPVCSLLGVVSLTIRFLFVSRRVMDSISSVT